MAATVTTGGRPAKDRPKTPTPPLLNGYLLPPFETLLDFLDYLGRRGVTLVLYGSRLGCVGTLTAGEKQFVAERRDALVELLREREDIRAAERRK